MGLALLLAEQNRILEIAIAFIIVADRWPAADNCQAAIGADTAEVINNFLHVPVCAVAAGAGARDSKAKAGPAIFEGIGDGRHAVNHGQ